jgi:hypothetical protein
VLYLQLRRRRKKHGNGHGNGRQHTRRSHRHLLGEEVKDQRSVEDECVVCMVSRTDLFLIIYSNIVKFEVSF